MLAMRICTAAKGGGSEHDDQLPQLNAAAQRSKHRVRTLVMTVCPPRSRTKSATLLAGATSSELPPFDSDPRRSDPIGWWGGGEESGMGGNGKEAGLAAARGARSSTERGQARTKVFLDAGVVVLRVHLLAVGATVRDAVRLTAEPGRHAEMVQSITVNLRRKRCITYGIMSRG